MFDLLFRLGSNPEEVFPYKALEDQLRKFGKFGLAIASMLVPLLMSGANADTLADDLNGSPNNSPNNSSNTESGLSDVIKKRLRDIVSDMYRLGYI